MDFCAEQRLLCEIGSAISINDQGSPDSRRGVARDSTQWRKPENERGLLGSDAAAKTTVAYCADDAFALLMCLNSLSVMVVFYCGPLFVTRTSAPLVRHLSLFFCLFSPCVSRFSLLHLLIFSPSLVSGTGCTGGIPRGADLCRGLGAVCSACVPLFHMRCAVRSCVPKVPVFHMKCTMCACVPRSVPRENKQACCVLRSQTSFVNGKDLIIRSFRAAARFRSFRPCCSIRYRHRFTFFTLLRCRHTV